MPSSPQGFYCVHCNKDQPVCICAECGAYCACKHCGALCDCDDGPTPTNTPSVETRMKQHHAYLEANRVQAERKKRKEQLDEKKPVSIPSE